MDNFSHAGYVAWFGLIEIICKENGNKLTGKLEISPTYLKRKLRISSAKLKQIFNFCSTNGKLSFDFSKEKWSFYFPKVAEIKDNYTKDLQVTSKKLSNHKEVEVEVEVEAKAEVDKKKKVKKKDVWILPEGIKPEVWQEYEDHRKTTKTKLTDAARTKNANVLLNNLSDQQEIIDATIANGWTGLFPLKKGKVFKSRSEKNTDAKEEFLRKYEAKEKDITPQQEILEAP
ncbi:hypothetical protein KAR91_36740 [Candidatus Pacearchaeota archaeon]|nr:hypothetical protein [Candidatus Pacearchaeota archaeon]